MDPALIEAAIPSFPRLKVLLEVATHGASFPILNPPSMSGFKMKASKFRPKYLAHRTEVHHTFAQEQQTGWTILLNNTTLSVLELEAHPAPVSWEPKLGDPVGRVIVDCTAGVQSLNKCSDSEQVDEKYGVISYPTVVEVAELVRTLKLADPQKTVLMAIEDISRAFQRVDLHSGSAPLVVIQLLNMVAVPLTGIFGYTAMPAIWELVSSAIMYAHNNYPTSWTVSDVPLLDSSEFPLSGSGRSKKFVDDIVIVDYEEGIDSSVQSFKRCTHNILGTPDGCNLAKEKPTAKKQVWVGWLINAENETIEMAPKAYTKLRITLFGQWDTVLPARQVTKR
jgi:hypothetical protein